MRASVARGLSRVAFGVLLLCVLACGKKTAPVPPDTILPAPISDLTAQLDEKGVGLSWSYPSKTVQGSRIPYQLESFLLERAVVSLKDACDGCPPPYGAPIEIKAEIGKSRAEYREPLLRSGHRYVYRVRTRAGWLVTSEPSKSVTVVWDTPPAAPRDLQIEAEDRALSLRWLPPAGLLDGSPLNDPLRYQLFRSTDGRNFSPLGGLIDGLAYRDEGLRNGVPYHYRLRAVRLHQGIEAPGAQIPAQSASPKDLIPPPSPRQITVLAAEGGVRLLWESVAEADLAGFRIYRRLADQKNAERIGEVGPNALSFVDTKPPKGQRRWSYLVTAFDWASPANESSSSVEAVYELVQ